MRRRYGISVGRTRVTAAPLDGSGAEALTVQWDPPEDSDPALALEAAFGALRSRLDEGGAGIDPEVERSPDRKGAGTRERVTVAILPPLVEARLVELPPLSDDAAARVVQRDASRHFLLAAQPAVVGVQSFPGAAQSGPRPFLACAVSRTLADAIPRAVEAVGWELEAIVPAHSAWLSGMDGTSGAGALVAVTDGTVQVFRVENGRPVGFRRAPAEPGDGSWISDAVGEGPGTARILAPGTTRDALTRDLGRVGWRTDDPSRPISAEVDAAARADGARCELVPARLAMARRDRKRRIGVGLGVAAVALVVAAGLVQLWGASRQLERVREQRAEIRPAVAPLLAASDSLAELRDRLASIESLETGEGGWTMALVELSVVLPDDVYLVGLQAAGDTLALDAIGSRAGDALGALARASSFHDVRLEGPIQRDVEGGETTRERFTLSALRVRAPGGEGSSDPRGLGAGEQEDSQ